MLLSRITQVHFLDSPEQALLVIPIFSAIKPRGGGTYICTDGLDKIARHLATHPEGVRPTPLSFTPADSTYADPADDPGYWSHLKAVRTCSTFVELTGDVVVGTNRSRRAFDGALAPFEAVVIR